MSLRADLQKISEWIEPGCRALDLGCGDGTLLTHLRDERDVQGYGLEIDPANIAKCIRSGVNVIQRNLDEGLSDFDSQSFDYVLMTQALQVVKRPDELLEEMLRIGREGIVTFPNFGHWRSRLALAGRGLMPTTPALPERWYDTPNIHLCTVRDFEQLCDARGIKILARSVVDSKLRGRIRHLIAPNLMGEIAIYRLMKR